MDRPVVVISGGSRGLGAGISRTCFEAGYVVATFSGSATPFIVQQRADDPEAGRFYWAQIDGRDDDALSRFVAGVADRYSAVDALVNNAAVGRFGPFAANRTRRILCDWFTQDEFWAYGAVHRARRADQDGIGARPQR